jgi:pimeloyl-ACP methyl ester carboxylesterase
LAASFWQGHRMKTSSMCFDELPKGVEEIAFGQHFRLAPDQVYVIGGSFGGAAAILLSLDPRVKRVVANCPVVDWGILDKAEKAETSKKSYAEYIREAFGNGYPRRSLLTCVLVKEADRWLITAAHNTDIVPVPFPVG